MQPLTVFISHTESDHAFCQTLAETLRRAGAEVSYDEFDGAADASALQASRALADCRVFVILLSPAALASLHLRTEAAWYIELQAADPGRVVLPVVAEPIQQDRLWPFLRGYSPVDAERTELPSRKTALLLKTLSALGLSLPHDPEPAPSSRAWGQSGASTWPFGAQPGPRSAPISTRRRGGATPAAHLAAGDGRGGRRLHGRGDRPRPHPPAPAAPHQPRRPADTHGDQHSRSHRHADRGPTHRPGAHRHARADPRPDAHRDAPTRQCGLVRRLRQHDAGHLEGDVWRGRLRRHL